MNGEGAAADPMALLTERQREIAEALGSKNSELARWFTSAAVMTRTQTPAAWPEMCAHMCRDMMSRIPTFFDLPVYTQPRYEDPVANLVNRVHDELAEDPREITLRGKRLKALKKLDKQYSSGEERPRPSAVFEAAGRTEATSDMHQEWLDRAWIAVQTGFVGVAHLRNAGQEPADPARLLELFDQLEQLLAGRITASYWDLEAELQQTALITEPTTAGLERALRLARGQALNDFIDLLVSPVWLDPMRELGLFDSPPATTQFKRGYRPTPWAASRYLNRIAAHAPEPVTEVLLAIPATDNARINADIIETALKMPTDQAAAVAARAPDRLGSPFPMHEASPAAQLAAKLIAEDRINEGLTLAAVLFAAEPFEAARASMFIEVGFRHLFDDDHAFAEGLSFVGDAAVTHAPAAGLRTLVDALVGILDGEDKVRGRDGTPETSNPWRSAVEDHSQNLYDTDPRNTLVAAIRDLAVRAIEAEPEQATELISVLQSHDRLILRRILLHVLRVCEFPEAADLRRAAMLDRDTFNHRGQHHERYLLQQERFGELQNAEQQQVLAWIDEGPENLDRWKEAAEKFNGKAPTDAEVAQYIDGWRQLHLRALDPWLTGDARTQLDALNDAHGVYPYPEFLSHTDAGFFPVELPFTEPELRQKTSAELLELFRTWTPDAGDDRARNDGLARSLEPAGRENPEYWAALAPELVTAPPRYRQYLLSGLGSAIAAPRTVPLDGVLTLAQAHLADGPAEVADDEERRAGRRTIADLARWLIEAQPDVAREHAEAVWTLIETLTGDDETAVDDGDPSRLAAVREWTPTDADLPDAGVRGLAFTAAVRAAALDADTPLPGLRDQIREVIRRGLDTEANPSREVRAALATQLSRLVRVDREWAGGLVDPMLISGPLELTSVAWAAVLDHRPVDLDVVGVLLDAGAYDTAISEVAGQDQFSQRRREQLGMQLIGAAVFGTRHDRSALTTWFSKEEPAIRARAVEAVGAAINRTGQGPQSDEVLLALWRERLEALADADPEAAAYAGWAPCVHDLAVGAGLLVQTLTKSGGAIRGAREILDWAAGAAVSAPLKVIEVIDLIASGPDSTQLFWNDGRVRATIAAVHAVTEKDVRQALDRMLQNLAERGFGNLRPTCDE